MGFLDTVRSWFSSEVSEAKESVENARSRLETEMDRRERELDASPLERMEQIQHEISDDPMASIRDRIEGTQAHAARRRGSGPGGGRRLLIGAGALLADQFDHLLGIVGILTESDPDSGRDPPRQPGGPPVRSARPVSWPPRCRARG